MRAYSWSKDKLKDIQVLTTEIGIAIWICICGALDGLRFHYIYQVLKKSDKIRNIALKCVVLNGMIFLGSNLVWTCILGRMIKYILHMGDETPEAIVLILDNFFILVYYVLWQFPAYFVSFSFNAVWYNDLATELYPISQKSVTDSQASYRRPSQLDLMALEVYKSLFCVCFIVASFLWYVIPIFGKPMNFILLCWLYALYCFDYRWADVFQEQDPLTKFDKLLGYFEMHWIYFLGFGAPLMVSSYFFTYFVSWGIFAISFPAFIILAAKAKPRKLHNPQFLPRRLLMFQQANWMNKYILHLLRISQGRIIQLISRIVSFVNIVRHLLSYIPIVGKHIKPIES